jgi:hypothetical protein
MRGILRIFNTMFWCWIALSNVLAPSPSADGSWMERIRMLFQLGPIDSAAGLIVRASIPTVLWLFFDWVIRIDRASEVDGSRTRKRNT